MDLVWQTLGLKLEKKTDGERQRDKGDYPSKVNLGSKINTENIRFWFLAP